MPRLAALLDQPPPPTIFERDCWQRWARDPRHASWRDPILKGATLIGDEPPQLLARHLMACRRANDRRTCGQIQHRLQQGVATLVARRCLLGPCEDDDRLCDWLWALTHLATWANIAHLPEQDLPRCDVPCIDLVVCMTGVLLAESCEVLRPWLDTQSPHLADAICARLEAVICHPFTDGYRSWWSDPDLCYNNWTGVCAGAIATICASLGRQGHRHPQAYDRALDLIAAYLQRGFSPGGECDEGMGYWGYGMHYCCLGLSRVPSREIDRHIDRERLRQVARYPQRCRLFGNRYYPSNDGSSGFRIHPVTGAHLAALCDDPFLHRLAWESDAAGVLDGQVMAVWRLARTREALAAEPPPEDYDESGDHWLPDQQAALWRSAPGCSRLAVTIAGGHNNECHNHNDLGHINCWYDQNPVFIDLGAPVYTADFFGPRRYTYLTASSLGHSVPVIGGHPQRSGSEAAAQVVGEPSADGCCLDLTAAYPHEAGVRRWQRRVSFADGACIVEDRAELEPGTTVELRWWCAHEPMVTEERRAIVGPLAIGFDTGELDTFSEKAGDHHLRRRGEHDRIHCLRLRHRCPADGSCLITAVTTPA